MMFMPCLAELTSFKSVRIFEGFVGELGAIGVASVSV
jgi:hypothetical protein